MELSWQLKSQRERGEGEGEGEGEGDCIHMCIYTCTYVYAHVIASIYTCTQAYKHTRTKGMLTYTHVSVCARVCLGVSSVRVCLRVYTQRHLYTYVHG